MPEMSPSCTTEDWNRVIGSERRKNHMSLALIALTAIVAITVIRAPKPVSKNPVLSYKEHRKIAIVMSDRECIVPNMGPVLAGNPNAQFTSNTSEYPKQLDQANPEKDPNDCIEPYDLTQLPTTTYWLTPVFQN